MQSTIIFSVVISLFVIESIASVSEAKNIPKEFLLCFEDGITDVSNLGFKLLNQLTSQQGNIFLSPIGIAFSLGILYSAASNDTAHQIGKVLVRKEADMIPAKVEEELNQIIGTLRGTETNVSIVNEIFFEDSRFINEEYISSLKDNYIDEVRVVNSLDTLNESTDTLSNTTERVMENVFSIKTESPKVKIMNIFAFNNSWKVQFLAERTKRDYFYSGRRETTEVWMMTIEAENFKFYEDLEIQYKFLELPYENDAMSMILALPTQYDQPANLQMDSATFCRIKSKLIPTKLDMVSIPKLKFSEEVSFKEELQSLGIEDAFNGSKAQFPGLSNDENFYLEDVLQKISLEVDEDGSQAASITKLKFKPVAFRGVKEFIANHPFLFFVEDKRTGTILLSGRVDEPSESISFSEKLRF